MFNLFNKSKIRAGKQNNTEAQKTNAAAPAGKEEQKKKTAPFAALGKTWAKLNKMDRKQAYTWGAIAVVVLVVLVTLGTAAGSSSEDSFADFATRGYDLANMPFSTDEAEQYLLASKYPDMQNTQAAGLYTPKEKEARQAEDAQAAAEEAAELDTSASSSASQYVPGRYYGSGGSRAVTPTQVGTLNSTTLKSANGVGTGNNYFGPSGDFSNFKSQEKGSDVFTPQGPGSGDARKALFQTAVGSRAAAGLKDNKLINAKKAMMGGNIKGSNAFMQDSGAVDLSKVDGLAIDPDAPVSSIDPDDYKKALDQGKNDAEGDAQEEDEEEWWQTMIKDTVNQLVQFGLNLATSAVEDSIAEGKAQRQQDAALYAEDLRSKQVTLDSSSADLQKGMDTLNTEGAFSADPITLEDGSTVQKTYTKGSDGAIMQKTTTTSKGPDGQMIQQTKEVNLSKLAGNSFPNEKRLTPETIEQIYLAGNYAPEEYRDLISVESDGRVLDSAGKEIGTMNNGRFIQGENYGKGPRVKFRDRRRVQKNQKRFFKNSADYDIGSVLDAGFVAARNSQQNRAWRNYNRQNTANTRQNANNTNQELDLANSTKK